MMTNSWLLVGPPGTGKSTALGSIAEAIPDARIKLLAPKPREINSFKYVEHGVRDEAEIFFDKGWAPAVGVFEAGAFTALYKRVLALYNDEDYNVVILDPLTDVVPLAAHELMAIERVEVPRDLRDARSFYGSLKYRMKNFTQALVGLSSTEAARPKHVLAAVHAQPLNDEEVAKGIKALGNIQPMIEGSYRYEVGGEFDVVGYTRVSHGMEKDASGKLARVAKYEIQFNADNDRHAKIAIAPRLLDRYLPNDMKRIFEVAYGR